MQNMGVVFKHLFLKTTVFQGTNTMLQEISKLKVVTNLPTCQLFSAILSGYLISSDMQFWIHHKYILHLRQEWVIWGYITILVLKPRFSSLWTLPSDLKTSYASACFQVWKTRDLRLYKAYKKLHEAYGHNQCTPPQSTEAAMPARKLNLAVAKPFPGCLFMNVNRHWSGNLGMPLKPYKWVIRRTRLKGLSATEAWIFKSSSPPT